MRNEDRKIGTLGSGRLGNRRRCSVGILNGVRNYGEAQTDAASAVDGWGLCWYSGASHMNQALLKKP